MDFIYTCMICTWLMQINKKNRKIIPTMKRIHRMSTGRQPLLTFCCHDFVDASCSLIGQKSRNIVLNSKTMAKPCYVNILLLRVELIFVSEKKETRAFLSNIFKHKRAYQCRYKV